MRIGDYFFEHPDDIGIPLEDSKAEAVFTRLLWAERAEALLRGIDKGGWVLHATQGHAVRELLNQLDNERNTE